MPADEHHSSDELDQKQNGGVPESDCDQNHIKEQAEESDVDSKCERDEEKQGCLRDVVLVDQKAIENREERAKNLSLLEQIEDRFLERN